MGDAFLLKSLENLRRTSAAPTNLWGLRTGGSFCHGFGAICCHQGAGTNGTGMLIFENATVIVSISHHPVVPCRPRLLWLAHHHEQLPVMVAAN